MELISLPDTPLSIWWMAGIFGGIPMLMGIAGIYVLVFGLEKVRPYSSEKISEGVWGFLFFVFSIGSFLLVLSQYRSFIPDTSFMSCLTETCVEVAKVERQIREEQEEARELEQQIARQQREQERQIAQQQEEEREEQKLGKYHISDSIVIDIDQWESVYENETEIQQDRKEKEYRDKYVSMTGKIYDVDGLSGNRYMVQIVPTGRLNFRSLVMTATCTPTTDVEEELLFAKSAGDNATIVGVFKSYGDMTGMRLDYCSVVE